VRHRSALFFLFETFNEFILAPIHRQPSLVQVILQLKFLHATKLPQNDFSF
jgi:hypothetical protein